VDELPGGGIKRKGQIPLCCKLDGLLRRRVKLAEFGNCSPAIHRYSLYGLLALLYLCLLSLLAPWPLSPAVALVLMGADDSLREWTAGEYVGRGCEPDALRQSPGVSN